MRVARYQPLAFPGQEEDASTDRSYNIFRWYRSGWGRYTQADPIGLTVGLNLFAYGNGSPVTVGDRLGLYVVDRQVQSRPSANIRAQCPGLGSACTLGFYALLKCECDCQGRLNRTVLEIHGTLYYYTGNPRMLGGARPFDSSVADPASAINHEWSWHLDLGIAAVDPFIRELEQKSFASRAECDGACGVYGSFVSERFGQRVRDTQLLERQRIDPRNEF